MFCKKSLVFCKTGSQNVLRGERIAQVLAKGEGALSP
jgi:hypothetical protein